jgi:hypothetical protein
VSAVVTFAIAGGPASDDGAREVEGTGTAFSRLALEHKTSPAVRKVFRATRLAVTPDAATAARANAEAGAAASGIALGPLFSVVEAAGYGYDPSLGAFGPGQFCAIVRRSIGRRDPDTGSFRIIRRVRVRRCYKPSAAVRLEATYLGG